MEKNEKFGNALGANAVCKKCKYRKKEYLLIDDEEIETGYYKIECLVFKRKDLRILNGAECPAFEEE